MYDTRMPQSCHWRGRLHCFVGCLDRLCNDVPSARAPSAVLIVVETTGITECVPQAVEELTKGEGHINFEGVESWSSQVDDSPPNPRHTPDQRSNTPHWKGMLSNAD